MKEKNVVLVRLKTYTNMITPPLGIGYLLKVLEGIEEINPIFIDMHRDKISNDELLRKLNKLNPLVVGFQVFSVNYADFCDIIKKVKEICPKTKIIGGGSHVAALPSKTLMDNPELDFIIRGEGEDTLRLLVNYLLGKTFQLEDIPNLAYRKNNQILINELKLIENIDEYDIAWNLIEPKKYPAIQHGTFHKSNKVVPILTSRGCPYTCTFCAGHIITGRKIRLRSIKKIVDEIEFLQKTYGFEEFLIEDDNFTFYRNHVLDFSKEIEKRKINCYFSFPNGVRLDKLDKEIVYNLKKMGTYSVALGIESGSEKTLCAMKKVWDFQMIINKINLLKRYGIIVNAGFIMGFPDETEEDLKKTIDFAIKCGIDTACFANYVPLPASESFNKLIESGELELEKINWNAYTAYWSSNQGKIPYHPKDISEKKLLNTIKLANIKFYSRPKIIFNLAKRITKLIFLKNLFFRFKGIFG